MWSSAIEHAAWNVLGYWAPQGCSSPVRLLRCVKQPRVTPVDPRLASATLTLHTGQHDRVHEGPLLGLGGNGTRGRARRIELTPVAKVLTKGGPLRYQMLVGALCRKQKIADATAERWIAADLKAGRIVRTPEGLYAPLLASTQ
jgi:hypothetical protein